ncbi:MAG: hypothetical protein KA717_11440 [Woronichinia naegeliana WA131]|jgi:hypothetical protein|uniref:RiboL-PSP-HEPN domain-containing protein n=1 Tax=Woronichinia naegeliana WA131 TaxID=2824559 RepID=A0A977L0C6_9CYAN|nr:MAG: hypothetical protein KA717_11440 [Woronichinia naegeliana WA131]
MDTTARHKFLDRIATFRNALDSEIVISEGLAETDHNKRARILRNGLAIIGYTILEDFLKTRTGEVLNQVGSVGNENIPFERLPQALKDASIFDALQGLAAYIKTNKKDIENPISFVQEQTNKIASTQSNSYELSPFSMGWTQANVTQENIRDSLVTFGIDGGWNAIQQVTSLAGVTLLAPQESFKNAYLRRNKAAHDADADSPYDDLLNYIKEATAIAFSFDALITKSLYFVSQQDEGYLQNNKNYIKAGNLKIRFIIYNNGQWKRFDILQGEAINSSSDYQELVSSFRTRQTGKDEIIIIKNERNDIIDWELYSL